MLFYETNMSMSPKTKQMSYDTAFKLKVTESNNSNAARVNNYNNQLILHITLVIKPLIIMIILFHFYFHSISVADILPL